MTAHILALFLVLRKHMNIWRFGMALAVAVSRMLFIGLKIFLICWQFFITNRYQMIKCLFASMEMIIFFPVYVVDDIDLD